MSKPFGFINLAAEIAIMMGTDPRPYMTDKEIQYQADKLGISVKEWNLRLDNKLKECKLPF
jgi:hypothetical protein